MTIQVSSHRVNKDFGSASGGNVLTPCLQPSSADVKNWLSFHSHLFYTGVIPLILQTLFLGSHLRSKADWIFARSTYSRVACLFKILDLQNVLNGSVHSCFKCTSIKHNSVVLKVKKIYFKCTGVTKMKHNIHVSHCFLHPWMPGITSLAWPWDIS